MVKEDRIYRYILPVLNSQPLLCVNLSQFISHKEFAVDGSNADIKEIGAKIQRMKLK